MPSENDSRELEDLTEGEKCWDDLTKEQQIRAIAEVTKILSKPPTQKSIESVARNAKYRDSGELASLYFGLKVRTMRFSIVE